VGIRAGRPRQPQFPVFDVQLFMADCQRRTDSMDGGVSALFEALRSKSEIRQPI
jgi:hypothetical protein